MTEVAERPGALPATRTPARFYISYPGKRAFDLGMGSVLAVLSAPFIVACAVVLAVQHRANPIFTHDRVGPAGRVLRVVKLRTLSPHAPAYADKSEHHLVPATRFAAKLRNTHLDELPQLFLVALGRMSLVGPRPRMEVEAEAHGDPDFEVIRTSVHQGCTGLWQISIHGAGRLADHTEYDEYYVANRTMRLDLWILWRTAAQICGARPVQLSDVPRWALRSDAVIG